ncbi:MAG: mandelate racemase/muconate lactonizing enzyme family protein, partial [Planctomycetota bacterium]
PNAGPFFEYSIETGGVATEARVLYRPGLEAKDGTVQIPEAPGWGVHINKRWLANTDCQKSEV